MPKLAKILLLVVSVVFVLTIFLGVNSSGVSAASDDQTDGAYRQVNVYSEVLRHIQTDYVVTPDISAVTSGALKGLLESLDPDSSYLTAADYKVYKNDKPGRAQLGINVSKRLGYATVVSVVPGSPADKAGITDGDIIESIGPQNTFDLSTAMIRLLLDGQPGSKITLSVIHLPRRTEPKKLELTRVVVQQPATFDSYYENASILYLRPGILDKEHVNQIESRLKSMSRLNSKKVLLDLRDVSAGDMTEAIRLANLFLKSGTIASLEGQRVSKQTFTAEPSKAVTPTAPLVVLVNRGTAGPAELVAAALQDDKRAELVGEHTFGEGAQQKTFELPDGAALILSVAKYESPSGKKIQDEGVQPGTLVAAAQPDADDSDDDDNSAADTSTTNASKPNLPKQGGGVSVDDQLSKAIDLLKSKSA